MGYCTISKLNFWFKMNCSVGFLSPMSCFAPSCPHAAFFEASESFCSVVAAVGSKASNLPGGVRRLGELSMHTVDSKKLLVVYVVAWVKGVGEWRGTGAEEKVKSLKGLCRLLKSVSTSLPSPIT